MGSILVTGGTGTLGQVVVDQLRLGGHEVRVLSRRPQPLARSDVTWSVGNLRKNEGVDAAVTDVDVIVHCATSVGDAGAGRHLVHAARRAGGNLHLVYISIVGVDRIPLRYYRSKLETEAVIERSELSWSILRATQFHNLVSRGCRALARLPVMLVPGQTSFQPIDVSDVAARLVEMATGAPAGRVPEMGGPQVLDSGELARRYLAAGGKRRPVVPVRLPGAVFAGYRRGDHLVPGGAVGRVTFDDFLAQQFPDRPDGKRPTRSA